MTVRLSTDVGSDLVVIREAACQRALSLPEALTSADDGIPGGDIPRASQPAIAEADTVDAGA